MKIDLYEQYDNYPYGRYWKVVKDGKHLFDMVYTTLEEFKETNPELEYTVHYIGE